MSSDSDSDSSDDENENSYLTSGTSSDSDFENTKKEETKNSEQTILMEMMDEFEEPSLSTYAKFKTQNEIDPEQIEKYAPKKPELDDLDEILEFGTV